MFDVKLTFVLVFSIMPLLTTSQISCSSDAKFKISDQNGTYFCIDNTGTVNLDLASIPLFQQTLLNLTNAVSAINQLLTRISVLEAKLAKVTVTATDMFIDGLNLHIRNGNDGTANSLGNVIIGYDNSSAPNTKNGSHNLVMGSFNTYTNAQYGIVSGEYNTIIGPHNIILTGYSNTVNGSFNAAISSSSALIDSGSYNSHLSSYFSTITGNDPQFPASNPTYNSIITGTNNKIRAGQYNSILSGSSNTMAGIFSSIVGGESDMINHTSSLGAVICAGNNNIMATWSFSSFMGGGTGLRHMPFPAFSDYSAMIGGASNTMNVDYGGVMAAGFNNVLNSGATSYSYQIGGASITATTACPAVC